MSIQYQIDPESGSYHLSYQDLKSGYLYFCRLTDAEFLKALPEAIHFACICSYLKELSLNETLSDEGIIHQLAHLLTHTEGPSVNLSDIRAQFTNLLRLD